MPQNRITDLKCKWTSKEACLSHNHTQGYLLVNIFIVVFPFKIYPRQKRKRKQRQWPRKECTICFSLQHRDPSLNGSCALGFSNKWRKKDLALLKFWGEVWVSTLVWLDRICYHCNASRLEWSSSHHGIHLLALVPDLEEAVPGPCCHSHAIISYPQAADAVVMSS